MAAPSVRAAPAAAAATRAVAAACKAAAVSARVVGRRSEAAAMVALERSALAIAATLEVGTRPPHIEARLDAVAPCLMAQDSAALKGLAAGSARGLVSAEVQLRAGAAKHDFEAGVEVMVLWHGSW